MKIVTLCGSMQYQDRFLTLHNYLTSQGIVCFLPIVCSKKDAELFVNDIPTIHEVHNKKISLSDAILVVGDHVGDDTTREIKYANSLHKPIFYEEDLLQLMQAL